jgi:hypothetical protein
MRCAVGGMIMRIATSDLVCFAQPDIANASPASKKLKNFARDERKVIL